jgi:hypothetical protein
MFKAMADEELASSTLHAQYMTLLGGCAWCILTRADCAVYVQALQRRAHCPRLTDCRRLNLVVRYMKRVPVTLMYQRITGPLRLLCFSDAAFKAQEDESSGLALRGLIVLVIGESDSATASGNCHLVDFVVRRQKRVVRSTFSAELNALSDAVETVLLTQLIFHQVHCGTEATPDQLVQQMEQGQLYPPIDIFVDARAVFDALVARDAHIPLESSLYLLVVSIRTRILCKVIRRLGWIDTRSMIADGMTKGSCPRRLLVSAMGGTLEDVTEALWGSIHLPLGE